MDHDLEVFPDPAAVAARAAGYVAGLARVAAAGGRFSFAVSRLLSGDRSIPAGRVQAGHSLVPADAQAAERVRGAAPAHRNGDQG